MEFIKDKLYINRILQLSIVVSVNTYASYPIEIRLINKTDSAKFLCKDGEYLGSKIKSINDIITDIPLYEYKNEHIINDIFDLYIYSSNRLNYQYDNGMSNDNKNCVINILSSYQIKNIKNKQDRLQFLIRSEKWYLKKIKDM